MNTSHAPVPPFFVSTTPSGFKLSRIPFNSLIFHMRPGHTIARAGCDAMD